MVNRQGSTEGAVAAHFLPGFSRDNLGLAGPEFSLLRETFESLYWLESCSYHIQDLSDVGLHPDNPILSRKYHKSGMHFKYLYSRAQYLSSLCRSVVIPNPSTHSCLGVAVYCTGRHH